MTAKVRALTLRFLQPLELLVLDCVTFGRAQSVGEILANTQTCLLKTWVDCSKRLHRPRKVEGAPCSSLEHHDCCRLRQSNSGDKLSFACVVSQISICIYPLN